jgi:UDP-N-acetyl-D-mannosaminuronic acid dehydrogenase
MIEPFETEAPLLRTARDVNDSMPEFTVRKLREELDAEGMDLADASVLILGLTYRPGVEEIRASPSFDIAEQMTEAGAEVYGVDPLLDDFSGFELKQVEIGEIYDQPFSGVIVVTPHEEFRDINWNYMESVSSLERMVIIDGRDTFNKKDYASHRVYSIGGNNIN